MPQKPQQTQQPHEQQQQRQKRDAEDSQKQQGVDQGGRSQEQRDPSKTSQDQPSRDRHQ